MPAKKDKNDKPEEQQEAVGVFVFSDNSTYDGQYVRKTDAANPNGIVKRHGWGVFTDGGTRYDGQWVDDQMQGEGIITYDSGASYKGDFYQNQFNGRGCYTWPDGSSYEGQWRSNLMHGEGCYTDSNSRKWIGKFYDGKGPHLCKEVS
jgi:hypothetical protein